MIWRKTTIPNLLGASMALTGCGKGEPIANTDLGVAMGEFCLVDIRCRGADPVDDNAELREENYQYCRLLGAYGDFLSQYLSDACTDLFINYYDCYAEASATLCDPFDRPAEVIAPCNGFLVGPFYYSCSAMFPDFLRSE